MVNIWGIREGDLCKVWFVKLSVLSQLLLKVQWHSGEGQNLKSFLTKAWHFIGGLKICICEDMNFSEMIQSVVGVGTAEKISLEF